MRSGLVPGCRGRSRRPAVPRTSTRLRRLGQVATSFAGLPDAAKWVLVAAMLAGRLEIFTLLVLFTPAFWRR